MNTFIVLVLLSITTLGTTYLTIEKIFINKRKKHMQDETKNPTNEELLKRIQALEEKIEGLRNTLLAFTQTQTCVMQQLSANIGNSNGKSVKSHIAEGRKQSPLLNKTVTKPNGPEKTETFPAMPKQSNGNVVLATVSNEYRSQATFIIETKGNLGLYHVNEDAQNSLLNYLDTKILPYTDCELRTSGVPQKIVTEKKGRVMLKDGVWVIETKAVIKIY